MTTLAELVTRYPGAAGVLHRHGLDYCCGGARNFSEACEALNLDASEVLAEIHARRGDSSSQIRWEEQPPGKLIDYILSRYHEPLREELPRLIALSARVEKVHAGKPSCPKGLERHLIAIREAVESHLAKEEQILFPMIKSGQLRMVFCPIRVMMDEHEDHGKNLRKTREITHDFGIPSDACATWAELYRSLEGLEKDLMDHISLENNILFPRAAEGEGR